MAHIFDLSHYDIYRLQSIDPIFSDDWRQTLCDIFPKLDKESQNSVFRQLLVPRGIMYDKTSKKFFAHRPISLSDTLALTSSSNDKVMMMANHMLNFLKAPTQGVSILELADKIEAMLDHFDSIELYDAKNEHHLAKKIRQAFLYDLSHWIDNIEISLAPGLRNLTPDMIRAYFKSVFLKHQIQGWEFRSWDGQDMQELSSERFPVFLQQEAVVRRYVVVETPKYWFLIGPTRLANQNPFSFRRFLFEDSDVSGQYIYLTHVVVEREGVNLPANKANILVQLSRMYTLERSVNEAVKIFINSSKDLLIRYIYPLIRKPLATDGRPIEAIIEERMQNFEKQFSILILNKLPRIFDIALKDINDLDFFYYHLDWLIANVTNCLRDFCLQPLASFSLVAKRTTLRLVSMRMLTHRIRNYLNDVTIEAEQKQKLFMAPMQYLDKQLTEVEEEQSTIDILTEEVLYYQKQVETSGFLRRLITPKAPKYSLEELTQYRHQLNENLFMSIIRLAKDQKQLIVYPEFECNIIIDENFRHYAFIDGELGLTRLPKLLCLPEKRDSFDFQTVRQQINADVFRTNQEWG
ncbi:MAG TPA: hypothetical protein DEP59_04940 [Moraxella sp.]|nr:hypothetical protein [Moraxella sp.]